MFRSSLQPKIQGAGTILRVVPQRGFFYCGMCRERFANFSEAFLCVSRCWKDFLALDAVIEKASSPKISFFRCRFCARDYAQRSLAENCALDCKTVMEARFAQVSEAWAMPPQNALPQRTSPKFSTKARVMPTQPFLARKKKPMTSTEPGKKTKEPIDHPPKTVDSASSEGKKDLDHQLHSNEKVSKKKPPLPKKPFHRDHAEYVCNICHERYYTRDEVMQCFEGHSNQ